MNVLKCLGRFQASSRQFVTTSARQKRTLQEFKELQRQMQVDDGVPVYLKKGPTDRLIVNSLFVAMGAILIYAGAFVKKCIYPPPPSG